MITVGFSYLTGMRRRMFRNPRLAGSWNGWEETPMVEVTAEDGCPAFTATVQFDDAQAGQEMSWGVRLDGPQRVNVWAITAELPEAAATDRHRRFTLPHAGDHHEEQYLLVASRHLGAQKLYGEGAENPDLRFAVWAPNARAVDVVFSTRGHGYIDDEGKGVDMDAPEIALDRRSGGVWESRPVPNFAQFVGAPYMFRITNRQGQIVYRTDIHSRWQSGRGDKDPSRHAWDGDPATLDGGVSCSVVVDQDVVRREFEPTTSPPDLVTDEEFWADEFTPGLPVPTRVEDLVIYELHVGSLGFPRRDTGTLADAMALLDHLRDLGVNAVELLPVSEFSGSLAWGYGDTHHFVIESSAGGRDKYKHFVRECHRRGIAVVQDVVYNHYDNNAARAEWQYDSGTPEENIYYWYEGDSSGYERPDHGYLDNGSSGFSPRYSEEQVRRLFIGSAAEFVEEFHVDGFRVDLTQAIHRDNRLHKNGDSVPAANLFGQKLLREWSLTLRLIRPSVMLIAEDHTDWSAVTELPDFGGLGFDAAWLARFYHHLIGDAEPGGLIREAGLGHDGPLPMGRFADRLRESGRYKITYHESHDEAGNSGTMRTATAAVNGAPLFGPTRDVAEARCRVAVGLAMLSAGTPMFFMGEEIVAQKIYRYDNIADAKEDLLGERAGSGARMFRFYQDLIRLRLANRAIRSHNLDVIHVQDANRMLAFTRRMATSDVLVAASLSNHAYDRYLLEISADRLPAGDWIETLNSDAGIYGGSDVGDVGARLRSSDGRIELRLPANGFVVLQRV
ncbi:MAG TPA: alpha-amylase family glycosyl hydrolase [Acidimicrobiales bacterium]|nr:alpha-amylase family glycosyl hydrolase [Acidimicrobiales bacterium]